MATNIAKEEENFLRIVYLNYRVGTTALRRYFDNVHPNLSSDLSSPTNKKTLTSLYQPTTKGQKRVLYKEQWDILYPPSGTHVVSSADLDVTLLVCLLRNLPPPVSPPPNGFDVLPQPTELSHGDQIARIKYYKNFIISHSTDGKLSDYRFNTIWIDMETAIKGLGNKQDVKDAAEAKTKVLDCKAKIELLNLKASIKRGRKRFNNHTRELAQHSSEIAESARKIAKLERTAEDKERGSMIDTIKRWKMDDSLFIETRAAKHVLSCLSKHSCVTVIGPSGCGKSFLAQHVALQFESNGYTIIIMTYPTDMDKYYESDRKTLYIVDNVCGNFTANYSRIETWRVEMCTIEGILKNNNCKLILTCRLQIFQNEWFDSLNIIQTCVCNLKSENLSLTLDEKIKLTKQYFEKHAHKALEQFGEYEFLPFLCKSYLDQKSQPKFKLERFLNDPFSFYKKELTSMYDNCKEGRYKYFALLLLVIFNNKLEENVLTGKDPKVQEIIEAIKDVYKIYTNIKSSKLMTHLPTLTGTFVTHHEGFYQSIHDKLFDFLADYFGNHRKCIDILIKFAEASFIQERFVVTEENIADVSKSDNYLINVPTDKLQMYVKRVFDDIVGSTDVNQILRGNRNCTNLEFQRMLVNHMNGIEKKEIVKLMETENSDFLNKIFIMRKNEIKKKFNNWGRVYDCYGICIPNDFLSQYIQRWFEDLTKTNHVNDFMTSSRPFFNARFRLALSAYIRKLNKESIALIIEKCSNNFLDTMFVKSEDSIMKHHCEYRYASFGIVIPPDLVQKYIERQLDYLMKGTVYFLEKIRLMHNESFRADLCAYMTQLTIEQISFFIQHANEDFLCKMFVMTRDDIKDISSDQYRSFGIVIHENLIDKYIKRWLKHLNKSNKVEKLLRTCRPLENNHFRSATRLYMLNLQPKEIASLISNGSHDFLTHIVVMTENDIDESNIVRRCGVIIPSEMIEKYIDTWFDLIMNEYFISDFYNRLFSNDTFCIKLQDYLRELPNHKISVFIQKINKNLLNRMFVMTHNDIASKATSQYERFGIVITENLLGQYLKRWFDELTKKPFNMFYSNYLEQFISKSRPFKNADFRERVQSYMNNLKKDEIMYLIQSVNKEFFNKMFVMTKNEIKYDIKDNSEIRYECVGIIIPDKMVDSYCERFIHHLTHTSDVEKFINSSRPWINVLFRAAICMYIRRLNTKKMVIFVQSVSYELFKRYFILIEDIKDDPDTPDGLLQYYIETWVGSFSGENPFLKKNYSKQCTNITLCTAVHAYMKGLRTEKIIALIQDGDYHFLNRVFVMEEDDIKDNDDNRYENFGIVITKDLLSQYIDRWFKLLIKSDCWMEVAKTSRPMKSVHFRAALDTYLKTLSTEQIASLIQDQDDDFISSVFVMTDDDIKDDSIIRHASFSIVIPNDTNLIHKYVERWFKKLTSSFQIKELMNCSKQLTSVTFCNALQLYIYELSTETKAAFLEIGSVDFFHTMFVIEDDDINDNSEHRYECFGVVIPENLLEQYCERFFELWITSHYRERFINDSRPFMNVKCRTALRSYMSKLDMDIISSLIQIEDITFINTMFVMEKDDIKDNDDNRYECLGIVITKDLLSQYIDRWFKLLIKSNCWTKIVKSSRPMQNVQFRAALGTYMNKFTTEQITFLMKDRDDNFICELCLMTEADIKDDSSI